MEALAEAARLEAARVYGETLEQHRAGQMPAVDVDDIDRQIDRASRDRKAQLAKPTPIRLRPAKAAS